MSQSPSIFQSPSNPSNHSNPSSAPAPPAQTSSIQHIARKTMKQAFKQFDYDNSGFIQYHQLAMLLKKLTDCFYVESPSQEDISVVFRELDVNGDGKISKKEFQCLVEEIVKIVQHQYDSLQ